MPSVDLGIEGFLSHQQLLFRVSKLRPDYVSEGALLQNLKSADNVSQTSASSFLKSNSGPDLLAVGRCISAYAPSTRGLHRIFYTSSPTSADSSIANNSLWKIN
jgi:hypothetical protein